MMGDVGGNRRSGPVRPRVWIVSVVQVSLLAAGALLAVITDSLFIASVVAGGVIETTGRAYFSFQAFRFIGAGQSRLVLASFRKGEAGKFLLSALFFGALFAWVPVIEPIAVFMGYGVSAILGTLLSIRFCR